MATNISSYNVTPTPMYGTGGSAYGAAPELSPVPPSMYEQTESIYPDLGLQAQIAGRNIGAGLMGELSPQTLFQLQQNAARFGQSSGMPGSGLNTNMGLLSLGQNVEARQSQALGEYENLAKTLGSMQTPQDVATGVATWNATNLAAPSPEAAAKQQMSDWMRQFNMTKAAGKGGGGATGVSMPQGGTRATTSSGFGASNPASGVSQPYASAIDFGSWQPDANFSTDIANLSAPLTYSNPQAGTWDNQSYSGMMNNINDYGIGGYSNTSSPGVTIPNWYSNDYYDLGAAAAPSYYDFGTGSGAFAPGAAIAGGIGDY